LYFKINLGQWDHGDRIEIIGVEINGKEIQMATGDADGIKNIVRVRVALVVNNKTIRGIEEIIREDPKEKQLRRQLNRLLQVRDIQVLF
jgi:hypothetical protein